MGGVRGICLGLATAFVAAASSSVAAQPTDNASSSSVARCQRADFRVVLDVGHTRRSPGAKSARGVDEFDFNLRLANMVDQALRDAGFAKTVLLVTDGPAVRSMYTRVAHANELGADLLLSIHHDSVPDRFLEKWEFDGKNETYCDRFKGHSLFVSDDNPYPKDSLAFASLLGRQLKARGLQYTPHYAESFMGHYQHKLLDADAGVYRYDTLFVLKKTHMPAVLLEAGSIANREEELQLETADRRQLTAASVVAAVDAFCAARPTKPSAPEVARHRSRTRHVASMHPRRHARDRTASAVQPKPDMH
ncbi:MAG TPA: N-acetylmuramoyl-L-alanine amidase [Pseudolabrys sp.]|nr:N-acetylmuramoyl-L-alanine amidase [Pseudolabrys sp.]